MAKRGQPEIIEVIDCDAFTDDILPRQVRPDAAAERSAPRRRLWIAPVALGVIVAVVVGASLFSTPSNGSHRAASATTVAPSTTTPGFAAPGVLPLVPTLPLGYMVEALDEGSNASAVAGVVREVWATNPASAERSSWFTITVSRSTEAITALGIVGQERVTTDAGIAVVGRQRDGKLVVAGPIAGGAAAIELSGVNRAAALDVFARLRMDGSTLRHDDPMFGGTYQLVASDADEPQFDQPRVVIGYSTAGIVGGSPVGFTVTVASAARPFERKTRAFFLTRQVAVSLGNGRNATVGIDVRAPSKRSLVVARNGLEVSVIGDAPLDVIAAAAGSIHVATRSEVAAIRDHARAASKTPGSIPQPPLHLVQVASGALSTSGVRWTAYADVDGAPLPAQLAIIAGEFTYFPVRIGSAVPAITRVATPELTALVALVPHDQPGATLRITMGIITATYPAVDVDPTLGVLVAVGAFDQTGPYTARLVDAAGKVMASVSA